MLILSNWFILILQIPGAASMALARSSLAYPHFDSWSSPAQSSYPSQLRHNSGVFQG